MKSHSPRAVTAIKRRWRTTNDIILDVVTFLMVISLIITSFLTFLDWFIKTTTGSFLLSYTGYNTCSLYFIIMFIITDLTFVYLFDEDTLISSNEDDTRSSVSFRSKLSSIRSIKYALSNALETLKSVTKEELTLLGLIVTSYIARCTLYSASTHAYIVIVDIGYAIVRFITFMHINDYYGIRPYLLSVSFLLFLLRDIVAVLYYITIDEALGENELTLFNILVNFTTDFYLFHKILCRLIYPNVHVYHNLILKFISDEQQNTDVFTNGFGGSRDTPYIAGCFEEKYRAFMYYVNLTISSLNALISCSLIYFTFDRRYRKSFTYYSLLNYFCVSFIVQSFLMRFIKTGQRKSFSAFKIWTILFYLSVFRFFSLSRDFWFIWVNILNTLLFIDLVFFIGELNHYKNDIVSKLRLFGWFIMCCRYYYEGLSGLQDTLYGSQAHGASVLLWNAGLFFEQNTYFTCMKLIVFKFIWWHKDQFRYKNILEYQREKQEQTNNYGVNVQVAWKKESVVGVNDTKSDIEQNNLDAVEQVKSDTELEDGQQY